MTPYRNRLICILCLLCPLVVGLPQAHATGLLKQVQKTHTIKVGIANEIPYGYRAINGQVQGIAPDTARQVLHALGIRHINWVVLPFGALIPALKAGRIDMAAASQNVLPTRCRQVAFSRINSSYGEGLLVVRGNPHHIHGYAAFRHNPGLRLGIVTGADELRFAQAAGIRQSQIVLLNTNSDAIPALLAHRIDAYAATGLTVHSLSRRSPAVAAATSFVQPRYQGKPTRSYGAFAFRKSDKAMITHFDRALARIQKTPSWAQNQKHYGLTNADVDAARKARTSMLCAQH